MIAVALIGLALFLITRPSNHVEGSHHSEEADDR
jgi:hypothetical protein